MEKIQKRFENLVLALNVQDGAQNKALLLNYLGNEAYVYENLSTRRPDETYDAVTALLDGHFSPQNNITYERYVFQNVRQYADENIHQFYICVKGQAVKWDFGATLGTEIRQQIILARNNNKLRLYCFRNQDVTLQQLLLHAKSLEDAESQAREIEKMTENVAAVNLTRQQQPSQLTRFGKDAAKGGESSHDSGRKTCFQCGGNYLHSRDCPAKGKKCNKCQKEGHFERCCRSKIRSRGSKKLSNQVTTSPSFLESNSDDSLDVFALTTFFQDNEGSNQVNNTNQANSRYSVHPVPPLNLQVNN